VSAITLARPYARAVFAHAQEHDALGGFSDMLGLVSALVSDARLSSLLKDPRLSRERRVEMLLSLGDERFDAAMQQFLRVLGERDRLLVLPEVLEQFEALRAEHEQRLSAEVTSAMELDKAQQEKIRAELAERTGRAIELVSHIDKQLLGGAVIRAGDRVLDASLRGRLQRLAQSLA